MSSSKRSTSSSKKNPTSEEKGVAESTVLNLFSSICVQDSIADSGTAHLTTFKSQKTAENLIDLTLAGLPDGLERVPEASKWGVVFSQCLDTALKEKLQDAINQESTSVPVDIHELSAWSMLNKRSRSVHIETAAQQMQDSKSINAAQLEGVKRALAEMNNADGLQSFLASKGYHGSLSSQTMRLEDLAKLH
jgi:hypothetical protein